MLSAPLALHALGLRAYEWCLEKVRPRGAFPALRSRGNLQGRSLSVLGSQHPTSPPGLLCVLEAVLSFQESFSPLCRAWRIWTS